MANWCSNTFTVTGSEKEVNRFVKLVRATRQARSTEGLVEYTEALDFEKLVTGANDEIGKSGALNSRLEEREQGRAVYTFETPYSAPTDVYAEVARRFRTLKFHCEFRGEEASYRGRFHAVNGESTVEHDDVYAEFLDFGLKNATAQSSLRVVRALRSGDAWSFRGRLLATDDGRLLLGLGRQGGFTGSGVFQILDTGEVRVLHPFRDDQAVRVSSGMTPQGACLFILAVNEDWAVTQPGQATLWKLDRTGALVERLSFHDPHYQPGRGRSMSLPDFVLPSIETDDGSLYGMAMHCDEFGLGWPGLSFDGEAFQVAMVSGGVLFRLRSDGGREVVHQFTGDDGKQPAALTLGTDGAIYGTTCQGGDPGPMDPPPYPNGFSGPVAFSFAVPSGSASSPEASQQRFEEHLRSRTQPRPRYSGGCGVLFRYVPGIGVSVVHRFSGKDGACPQGHLLLAGDGRLYGTTVMGGSANCGTIYRYDPDEGFRSLCSFTNEQGATRNGLTEAGDGTLCGVSGFSGAPEIWCAGTLFRYRQQEGVSIVHHFELVYSLQTKIGYTPNGNNPEQLVQGHGGQLYGLAGSGGPYQGGALFSFAP